MDKVTLCFYLSMEIHFDDRIVYWCMNFFTYVKRFWS
jgi:hypothetical protein